MSDQNPTSLELRLQGLNDLMRVAPSSIDVAETFDRIGEQVKRRIAFDRFSIAFYRPDDDFVETYAYATDRLGRMRAPLHASSAGEALLKWQKRGQV